MRTRSLTLLLPLLVLVACGDKKASPAAAGSGSSAVATASAPATPSATPPATAAVKAPSSDVPATVTGANVTMKDATLDGLAMKAISCKAANANPFAALTLLSPIAKQKAALDACVEKPAEVSVHVDVAAKKASDIRVAGAPTPAAAACIAKALEGAPWNDTMTCVVTFGLKTPAK